jgi:hypothetical protein
LYLKIECFVSRFHKLNIIWTAGSATQNERCIAQAYVIEIIEIQFKVIFSSKRNLFKENWINSHTHKYNSVQFKSRKPLQLFSTRNKCRNLIPKRMKLRIWVWSYFLPNKISRSGRIPSAPLVQYSVCVSHCSPSHFS